MRIPGGRVIILYKRRIIGKTRLIGEFTTDKTGVLYFSEDTPPSLQMRQLHVACAAFLDDSLLAYLEINSWDLLFGIPCQTSPCQQALLEKKWGTLVNQPVSQRQAPMTWI